MTISLPLSRPMRWRSLILGGGVAGAAGPLVFSLIFVMQNALRHDDDAVVEPVSALEAGDHGWVQQANFVLFGVLMLVFATGLWRALPATVSGRLGPALLSLSGCGLFLAALFPLRENAAGEVYDPGFHFVAGVTFFLSSALALLALSRPLAEDNRWRPLGTWCLVAGALALAGFVVLGRFAIPDGAPLHDYAGLAQRTVILVVTFPCLVAVATRLTRLARG
jgi:hypothetical membrane protein